MEKKGLATWCSSTGANRMFKVISMVMAMKGHTWSWVWFMSIADWLGFVGLEFKGW
jgi:hypothetical protein